MMEFYFPTEFGEQLAFFAAAASILLGLVLVAWPARMVETGLRSAGGMLAALGVTCLLFAQPMLYLGFGFASAGAALGSLVGLAVSPGRRRRDGLLLVVYALLAVPPLLYVFGLI